MTDMAVVYGTLANNGSRVDLHPILTVRDSKGRRLEEFRCQGTANGFIPTARAADSASAFATEVTFCPPQEILNPGVAFVISDILSDNVARTPTFGANSQLNIPGSIVAVKTGTTNNLRDNWTLGYTPKIFVATWVGNNDNSPMSYVASGVTGASPIWRRIMDELLKTRPSSGFTPPPGLSKVAICRLTGQLACTSCPSRLEYFISGTEPNTACTSEQIDALVQKTATPQSKKLDRLLQGANTFQR
jgi:membrane carboxypeptidase/penicillin-binding protein